MRGSIEVHRYLTERGIAHEFYRLDRPLRNIDEAAALLDLSPSQVVVAELFEARPPVLALVPATARASVSEVAEAAATGRVRPARASRITEHTGFLMNWLPPVGHERASRVVVDEALRGADVLYAAGGDPGVMLVIRSADLIRATAAAVAPISARAEGAVVTPDPVRVSGSNLLAG